VIDDGYYSRDEVPIRCLPILVISWVVVLVLLTGILYATGDDSADALGHIPTISYTAIGFPANRFFAVGLAILSLFVIAVCFIESDILHFWGASISSKLIFYTSCVTSILLFLTGQFNLGEIPFVHNIISFFAFSSVVVLNLFSVIGEINTDHEKLTALKLSCISVPVCNLVGLACLAQTDPTPLQFDLLGICEYIVVIGACIGTALYHFNFRGVQVLFCVELPRSEQPGSADLPAGLIVPEVAQPTS
jgi:hypothetical protein